MSIPGRLIGRCITVATLLFWGTLASAQEATKPEASKPDGPRAASAQPEAVGGMGTIQLFRNEQVQGELNLTDEQKARWKQFLDKIAQEMRDRAHRLRDLTGEERRRKMEQLAEELQKEAPQRDALVQREIESLLRPEQLKRFRQLELRYAGPWHMLRPDVVEALALTDAQKQQIAAISRDTQKKMYAVFHESREHAANPAPGEAEVSRSDQLRRLGGQVEEARLNGLKRAGKVLSQDQAKKLVALMGPPLQSPSMQYAPLRTKKPLKLNPAAKATTDKAAAEKPATDKPAAEQEPAKKEAKE